MNHFRDRFILILTACLLLPCQAVSQESPVLWRKLYSIQGIDYFGHTLAATTNGIYVGGTAVDTTAQNKSFIWLWKLNKQGERVFESKIEVSEETTEYFARPMVISVVPLITGDTYALIQSKSGKYFLLQLDSAGKEAARWPLVFTERKIHLTKMISVGKDDFMLIGSAKKDAFVAKISRQGKFAWEKVNASASMVKSGSKARSFYTDVSVSDTGQIWLLRNTGIQEQFFMGTSELELDVISLTGVSKGIGTPFTGRNGRLLFGEKGLLTIQYDIADNQGKDIRLRKLNQSGDMLWEISIFKEPLNLNSFMAVTLDGNNGYIVAGTDHLHLMDIAYINKAGKEIYRYKPNSGTEASWQILALAREGKNIFMLTSIFADVKAPIPSMGVSILKLKNSIH